MLEAHWQGLEAVEVVEHNESEALAVHTGSRTIVVGTTSGSSSAAVSTAYTRGSPRSCPVVVADVVETRTVAVVHIAGHIGASSSDLG